MSLIYNGTTISKLIYNSTEIQSATYNGTTVFNSKPLSGSVDLILYSHKYNRSVIEIYYNGSASSHDAIPVTATIYNAKIISVSPTTIMKLIYASQYGPSYQTVAINFSYNQDDKLSIISIPAFGSYREDVIKSSETITVTYTYYPV